MNNLAIVVNDELVLQYDRDKTLPKQQQYYLQKLDAKFDLGIQLQGQFIAHPDLQQRARYMSLSLMESILYQEDAKASASLAWLATRLPELKQVVALMDESGTRFELVFDSPYQPHQVIHFDGLNS